MSTSGWVCTNMCGATNWPCGQNCPHFRPAFNGPDLTKSCQGIEPGMRVTHREHPEWEGVVATLTGFGGAVLNPDRWCTFPRGGQVQPCVDLLPRQPEGSEH